VDSGVPSLTSSLRGIVTVNVEVRSLSSSVHSGTWGGPLPDPVLALAKMLASLVDDQGVPAVPGMLDRVRTLSPQDRSGLERLAYRESAFRAQSKLLDSTHIIGDHGTVYEKMWLRPSIAVNAIEASSRKQAANIINDSAWARIGIRIVPDGCENDCLIAVPGGDDRLAGPRTPALRSTGERGRAGRGDPAARVGGARPPGGPAGRPRREYSATRGTA